MRALRRDDNAARLISVFGINSSNRVAPKNASRRMSITHWSPRMRAARPMGQGERDRANWLIVCILDLTPTSSSANNQSLKTRRKNYCATISISRRSAAYRLHEDRSCRTIRVQQLPISRAVARLGRDCRNFGEGSAQADAVSRFRPRRNRWAHGRQILRLGGQFLGGRCGDGQLYHKLSDTGKRRFATVQGICGQSMASTSGSPIRCLVR